MSSSNCCFLTCIKIFQEAGEVVWYSYLFKNFPQIAVIHTVKGFGPITSWQIEEEKVEAVADILCWALKALQMVTAAM